MTAVAAAVGTLTGINLLTGSTPAANAAVNYRGGSPDASWGHGTGLFSDQTQGAGTESPQAIAIASHDRPVIVVNQGSTGQINLVRLTSSGEYDTTFNGDGRVNVNIASVLGGSFVSGGVRDVVVDSFDRTYVLYEAGYGSFGSQFAVTRFLPDGGLDSSWGIGGTTKSNFAGEEENFALAMALDEARHTLWIAGSDRDLGGTDDKAKVFRWDTDDWTALGGGSTTYPTSIQESQFTSIAVDPATGDAIAGGFIDDPSVVAVNDTGDAMIARFSAGTADYDTSFTPSKPFGRFGRPVVNEGESVRAIAVDPQSHDIGLAVRDYTGVTYNAAVRLNSDGESTGPEWNANDPFIQFSWLGPDDVAFSPAPGRGDLIVAGGFAQPAAGTTADSAVVKLGDDGLVDTSWGGVSPAGYNLIARGSASSSLPTRVALDGSDRVLVSTGDQQVTRLARFTATRAIPQTASATKILFDEGGNMFGMAAGSVNAPVVSLGSAGIGLANTSPAANEGGKLFYETGGDGHVSLERAAAADGSNPRPFLTNPYFDDKNVTRPTTAFGYVHALVDVPGQGLCHYFFYEDSGDTAGGTKCGLSDVAPNPGWQDRIAYVRNGNVYVNDLGGYNEHLVAENFGATHVAWGFDGTTLLFDSIAGPDSDLYSLTWQPHQDMFNSIPDRRVVAGTRAPSPIISSFVMAPDGGTPYAVAYTVGNEIRTAGPQGDMFGPVIYTGASPVHLGSWVRNLSVYPEGGVDARLEPASIEANRVPLQSKSPATQQATGANTEVKNAGLLKLNLFKSPILKLNLFKSPLLKLNLFKSPLLKLNLFKSAFGLANLGITDDLGGSPLVQQGLQQIKLNTLQIVSGPSWRERFTAPGMSDESVRLASLPLQDVSLAQVLALSPQIDFPSLEQLDLSDSTLGTISVTPFLLGNTRLSQIGGIDWCGVFAARGASDCGADYGVPGSALKGLSASLLSLQIAGFRLDDLPETNGHLNDLRTLTYDQVNFDLNTSILPNIRLDHTNDGGVDLYDASVGGALVKDITPDPNAVVDCSVVSCADPALSVYQASIATPTALRAESTVSQLGDALDGFPLNELALGLWGDPGDDPYDQPPAALGITAQSAGQSATPFVVSYTRTAVSTASTQDPTVTVELPFGFSYVPGSSKFGDSNVVDASGDPERQPLPDPVIVGNTLRWDAIPVQVDNEQFMQVYFRAVATAPVSDSAKVQLDDGYTIQDVDSEQLNVFDSLETGDAVDDAPIVRKDTLYFGRLDSSTDVDYFNIPVTDCCYGEDGESFSIAPGSTLTVYLSQLRYDADLVVYHPLASQTGVPLRPQGTDPAINAINDQLVANTGEPLATEGDSDVPLLPGYKVAGLSNNRGNRAEKVATITWPDVEDGEGHHGNYVLQVSGFNGAHGPETYAVRFTVTPPPSVPDASARAANFSGPGSAPIAPLGAADPAPSTLVLTNPTRLAALYGAAGAQQVADSLASYAATVPVTSPPTIRTVLPVDADPQVRAAYAYWDQKPNDPDRANDVVRAINEFVDNYLAVGTPDDKRPQLKSIVIAGTDEVIPMARVQDLTQIANERTFAQELRETALGTGGNNALYGAALAGKILTDDAYGAFAPREFGGEWLYVPDVALGRLVETPAQIAATVNEYVTPAPGRALGEVRPTKTLAVGTDFMKNLANDVNAAFTSTLPSAAHDSLNGDSWTRTDFENKITPTAADLISINVHYSPYALGPGSGFDPNHPDDPDVSATDATTAADLRRRLLFTMGCHSGFNITNYFYGGAAPADWPEALSGEPVSAYIGQTGFGLGVPYDYNAFSQKLMYDFARNISATNFGQALQQAKQNYLASGVTNPYDYKVIAEATYFGIPDYRLAGATSLIPAPDNLPVDDFGADNGVDTGIYHASLTVENPTDGASSWQKHEEADGDFYSLPGGEQAVVQDRPIQPKVIDDVTTTRTDPNVSGLQATGAFVNSLEIGDVDENFDPVLARPQVSDGSGLLQEVQSSDVVFPTKLADVSQYKDIEGKLRQRLSVVPAMFRSTGTDSHGQLIGDETRFKKIGLDVLYRSADNTDTTGPQLTNARAIQNGNDVDLSINASDFESGISRVVALVRKGSSNTFELYEMYLGEDGEFFDPSAYFAKIENVDGPVDIIFEAVNSASLVEILSNKGQFTQASAPDVINYSFDETPTSAPNANPVVFNKSTSVHFTETGPEDANFLNIEVSKAGMPYGGPTFPDNTVDLDDVGDYVINYSSMVGDASGSLYVTVTPPPTPLNDVSVSYSKNTINGVFQGGPVTVFLTPSAGRTLKYGVGGDPTTDYTPAGIELAGAGVYQVNFQTDLDAAADPPVVRTVPVTIVDPQAHQVIPELSGPKDGDVYTGPVRVHLKEVPLENAIQVSLDNGPSVTYPNNTFTVTSEGHHTVSYTTAGEPALTGVVAFDIHVATPPETVHVNYSIAPSGGFFTSPFTATVVSSDPSSTISVTANGLSVSNPAKFGDPAFPFQSSDGVYDIAWTTSRGSTGHETVKLDTKAPGIAITAPLNGQKYLLHQPLNASFFCSDVFLLGAGGCQGSQANGSVIDTTTVSTGTPRTFTVNAQDEAGHQSTKTATYEVTFAASGQCGGAAGHAALGDVVDGNVSAGLLRTIRVFLRVCDYNGTPVTDNNPTYGMPKQLDANGAVVRDAQGGCAPLLGLLPICLTQPRQTFFKPSGTGWYFDHDTSNLAPGTYRFRVDLDDGSKIYYTLTKKLLPLL